MARTETEKHFLMEAGILSHESADKPFPVHPISNFPPIAFRLYRKGERILVRGRENAWITIEHTFALVGGPTVIIGFETMEALLKRYEPYPNTAWAISGFYTPRKHAPIPSQEELGKVLNSDPLLVPEREVTEKIPSSSVYRLMKEREIFKIPEYLKLGHVKVEAREKPIYTPFALVCDRAHTIITTFDSMEELLETYKEHPEKKGCYVKK